jgi:hypothetical protein
MEFGSLNLCVIHMMNLISQVRSLDLSLKVSVFFFCVMLLLESFNLDFDKYGITK